MSKLNITFNGKTYSIDRSLLENAFSQLTASIEAMQPVEIILERSGDNYPWYYNGELADGNFIYDCLQSGATVLLCQEGHSTLELTSWELDGNVLKLRTSDNSVKADLTVTVSTEPVEIILERELRPNNPDGYWYYDGELINSNFVYDCLQSGGTVILRINETNTTYEVVSWELVENPDGTYLEVSTHDSSVGIFINIALA